MIRHYFKIAFRNLWKYKNQTLFSVTGLAVGFTCFALATLWIRYETSYDGFHKNADRIYCVNAPSQFHIDGVEQKADFLGIDSSFFSFFDVKIIEGNRDFLIANNKKLAVTQEKALQLFGTENPFGKIIKFKGSDYISEQYAAYYEFQLVEGEMHEKKYVLINESAAQAFRLEQVCWKIV